MSAFYNEIDPHAAAWLRELIKAGHIADGVVDERDIQDITPADLRGFDQCHFFAGIGVWIYALRRAGWPDDRPIWTGSCPCQPFSAAGKGGGFDDERHLWPAFHWLISQCRPDIVLGEQVASKDGLEWLSLVYADLEGAGYSRTAVDLCAAGVGAPHIRQRLWWVGERLADANGGDASAERQQRGGEQRQQPQDGGTGGMADAVTAERQGGQPGERDADAPRGRDEGAAAAAGLRGDHRPGPTNGLWRDADWLFCRDGKWRPVKPGAFALVDGIARGVGRVRDPSAPINADATGEARVVRLRGYGNAINAAAAQAFIEAVMA